MITFFKLLVYSGIRASQAYKLLASFDREKLIKIPEKGIARYPLLEFSKETKQGFFAYMPIKLADELMQINKKYRYLIDTIRVGRVSANTIRKWHYNKLIELGVPESIADFIQGRTAATVGAMHYLAKARQADSWYSRVVDSLRVIE